MGNNESTAQQTQETVQVLPGMNIKVPPQGAPGTRQPPAPQQRNNVNNVIGVDYRAFQQKYSPRQLEQGDLQNENWQSIMVTPVYVSMSGAGAAVATHRKMERIPGTNEFTEYLAVYLMFPLPSQLLLRDAEEQALFEFPKYIGDVQIVKPLKMVVESYWPKQDTIFVLTDSGTRVNMNLTRAKAVDWWNPKGYFNSVKIALAALMRDYPGQTVRDLAFTQVSATPQDYGENEDQYKKRLENNSANSGAQNMTLKTVLERQKAKSATPPTDDEIKEAFKKAQSEYSENLVFEDDSGRVVTAQEMKYQESLNQKLPLGTEYAGETPTDEPVDQSNSKIGAGFHASGGFRAGGFRTGGGGGFHTGGGGRGRRGSHHEIRRGFRFGDGPRRYRPYRGHDIIYRGGRYGYLNPAGVFVAVAESLLNPYYYGGYGGYGPYDYYGGYYDGYGGYPYGGGGGGLLNAGISIGAPQKLASLFR